MTGRHVSFPVIENEDRPCYTRQDVPLFLLADSVTVDSIRASTEDGRMQRIRSAEKNWEGIVLAHQVSGGRRKDEPKIFVISSKNPLKQYHLADDEILVSEAAEISGVGPSNFKRKMVTLGYPVRFECVNVSQKGGKELDRRFVCKRSDAQAVTLYFQRKRSALAIEAEKATK
jgi:hypothetical protein